MFHDCLHQETSYWPNDQVYSQAEPEVIKVKKTPVRMRSDQFAFAFLSLIVGVLKCRRPVRPSNTMQH